MDNHRFEKLNELKQMGINPYISSFKVTNKISDIKKAYINTSSAELLDKKYRVTVAGRVMAIREFGKAAFLNIKDRSGSIQVYIAKKELSEQEYEIFKKTDIGDFIGVSGYLFKTKTGELTVLAETYKILTKALRDLPEKWHGLKDVEKRYRQRYVDLIVNDEIRELFILRSKIIQRMRQFFIENEFIEVETPMMQPIAGGATARPFITHHNALDMTLYLRIAPELYLKRLVIGGLERVFEINRNFRNEGISTKHNPEFTMVEWYMAYADYYDQMAFTENMLYTIAKDVLGKTTITFGEYEIDLTPPWDKLTLEDSIEKYTDIKKDDLKDFDSAKQVAKNLEIKLEKNWGRGKIVLEIFEKTVEHKLIQPTFIIDYPKEVSPLAKSKFDNPDVTERFELFIAGMEVANGFNELNDPIDQKERFEKQVEAKEAGDEEAHMMDHDYIRALEYGLPPTAGQGLGVDRLVMLFTNKNSIREVILFPHMRPEDI
ncbi:lysyl-tRNA synthetase [Deferribacter desulfuricans SSM1]|uniref:Lysine--tRNA ligase n=1 Tax=Deferribacter desulfuricans (strain DSM 14783 / JCM 11476 / NBRC 101012 / SSM1) TaxID=639282 RepID=D3PDF1_DEFDS|nr:lysine--tRNA ligase [Deferribacter desulfuricans]BAI80624.1 lysyl-tRNA synthetase [Deferribacter desulfuricans SSM1]